MTKSIVAFIVSVSLISGMTASAMSLQEEKRVLGKSVTVKQEVTPMVKKVKEVKEVVPTKEVVKYAPEELDESAILKDLNSIDTSFDLE